jgi:sialic acid synthase SpsE
MKRVRIASSDIGEGASCFIVAEIGANFDALAQAEELIRYAARAGANAIKIQTFRADTLTQPGATFTFQDGSVVAQYDYFKQREISLAAHHQLQRAAEACGLVFFSTPSQSDDVDLLESIGVPAYKTGSDDLTNLLLLSDIARRGKPMIVSTGMATMADVERAVGTIQRAGDPPLILLHSLVGYPAPSEQANLRCIATLRERFGVPVGFSDHVRTPAVSLGAVALGAAVLEEHLTLERKAGGPDNDVAYEPDEFAELVAEVRQLERALGDGCKRVMPVEEPWSRAARKSLVACRDIQPGERLTRDNIVVKRPAGGIGPEWSTEIFNRYATRLIREGAVLEWDMFDEQR